MNIKNCGAANCFDYIALRARTQFHGHSRFNYVASHISNAANSVIRCICKKVFKTKKIFSSLHLKVLFLFMLTSLRSMSQMLFRGNLDFARCLCDRDHNGYLSHFWADASTLEAIHSWMVPVQPVQPVQELLSSRQWFWGITRLSGLGNWHLKDWDLSRAHPAHHYVHHGLVYLLLTKTRKVLFFWGVIGIALD